MRPILRTALSVLATVAVNVCVVSHHFKPGGVIRQKKQLNLVKNFYCLILLEIRYKTDVYITILLFGPRISQELRFYVLKMINWQTWRPAQYYCLCLANGDGWVGGVGQRYK